MRGRRVWGVGHSLLLRVLVIGVNNNLLAPVMGGVGGLLGGSHMEE